MSSLSQHERGLVWVVEDSPLEAEMIRRALGAAHDVETFGDGAAMLERLATGAPPDLVLLDLMLPGVSGVEACRTIRERYTATDLPVLILTVQARRELVFDAFELGVNDYLNKPVDARELLARVNGFVRGTRAHRSRAEYTAQLAATAAVGLAVTSGSSLRDVAERTARAIAEHIKTRGIAIAACDHAGKLETLASWGNPLAAALASGTTPPDGLVSSVFPLRVQGKHVGNLCVLPFGPHPPAVAEALAHLLAVALERAASDAERMMLLERERQARASAEAANRAKDEFLAILSHELRTPLNAIVGWSSLLRQGNLGPDRVRTAVEKIERNALAQTQLIDDLLDISRIVSGKLSLRRGEVDVAAAVRASAATVELAAHDKGVTLEVRGESGAFVTGDVARLQQVVSNLLSNAVRFTPAGGRITVTVALRDDDVSIEVADTGPGIAPEFLPHIFERFTQGNTTKARSHGGLGLGLAIVRHLTELHGGKVFARSGGPGQGATFEVRIPASDAVRASERRPAAPSIPASGDLAGVHVLVVDDERDCRDLVQDVLEPFGAVITTAGSASEALSKLDERHFAAIISDIGMPGFDGLSLMRHVRNSAKHRGIPAIGLSAYAAQQDEDEALKAGFDVYMRKPVDTVELVDRLVSLTSKPAPPSRRAEGTKP